MFKYFLVDASDMKKNPTGIAKSFFKTKVYVGRAFLSYILN